MIWDLKGADTPVRDWRGSPRRHAKDPTSQEVTQQMAKEEGEEGQMEAPFNRGKAEGICLAR